MSNSRILVTGGCGFIGTHVVKALLSQGYRDITVIDNLLNGKREFLDWIGASSVNLLPLDITDPRTFEVVTEGSFEACIHLAALHYIPYCDAHPMQTCRVNVEGTQNILSACVAGGIGRFFHASTAAVYRPSDTPHHETDALQPVDIYGISKLSNEEQVRLAARTSDCLFAVGRLFNAVGAYETNPHLIPQILRRLRSSSEIEIGNLTPRRDYIHVADVADAILAMIFGTTKSFDIRNIGSGRSYSVSEVVDCIGETKRTEIRLIPSSKYIRAVDRPVLQSNNQGMLIDYGWRPKRSLRDAIAEAIDFDRTIAPFELTSG